MEKHIMTAFTPARSTFDPFLFAILIERGGLPLTVLSILSRLDLDPWQEAARLSELPKAEAINSFTATIWKSLSPFVTANQANDLASRVIELLPSREPLAAYAMAAETADLSTIWIISAVFFSMMAVTDRHTPRPDETNVAAQSLEVRQVAEPALLSGPQHRE
jgi:hypothetical protein